DPMLQDGLGQAYESTLDWPKAFAAYRRAIALNPKDSSYALNMGLALLRSDPNGNIKDRRDLAIQYLRDATKLNPQGAPAFLQLGLLYIEKKRWTEAQDALRRYVTLNKDDFIGLFNLALSYDYAGNKFDDALKFYSQAEALQPQDPAVKNNVGRIYLKRKLYDDAIAQFRKALEIDADFIDARNNLALALAAKDDLAGSNAEWKKLIDSATASLKRFQTPAQRAETQQRIIAARAALAENYLKDKLYADSAAEYKALLKLAPNNLAAMSNLGLALYHTREYAQSLKYYDEILKRQPNNAVAHNNRGVVLEAMNNRGAALAAYKKAVELKPDYAEAKSNRDRLLAATVVS
ncbi:MAG TPA: tetratricopeptide repeat protein, partial [Abditibacteriaceae bacterium]